MKIIKIKVAFKDKRGEIIDLLENVAINAITMITFRQGAIRANHYHKKTVQYNYILSGKIKFITRLGHRRIQKYCAEKGDMVKVLPNEQHALMALSKAVLLVFTRGPRGGKEYETDTYRLTVPLFSTIKKR